MLVTEKRSEYRFGYIRKSHRNGMERKKLCICTQTHAIKWTTMTANEERQKRA